MDLYNLVLSAKLIKGKGGGGDAEVWFTGDDPDESGGQVTFHALTQTKEGNAEELYNNYENYEVYINDEILSESGAFDNIVLFANGRESMTIYVSIDSGAVEGAYVVEAVYLEVATAPASVEVSVKAK